ncbi:hypothetical protein ES703_35720 [subsurface metagenome]
MKYEQGDVVLVKVVFSERTGSKKRPALVISTENYHNSRQEVIIAAITNNIKRILKGDTSIENWQEAGLKFPSIVTGIIQTIKQNMIINKLGTLSDKDLQKVKKNIKDFLLF